MKKQISGIVYNMSTNPFQALSKKRLANSTLLTFDISFDLCDEDGNMTHVWFNRSVRLPPPLEDDDCVEVSGHYGQLFGFIGRTRLYASRIVDTGRNKEYTAWRNRDLGAGLGNKIDARSEASGQSNA